MQTVCFDFDGVIHSYVNGWQGPTTLKDPPVPGIREFIDKLKKDYRIVVVSSRCDAEDGREAIKRYMQDHRIYFDSILKEKPPAHVYIDDRAICFTGPSCLRRLKKRIDNFQPWTKKE